MLVSQVSHSSNEHYVPTSPRLLPCHVHWQDVGVCLPARLFGPLAGFAEPAPAQVGGRLCTRQLPHVDIDYEDQEDPMACTTYVNDIFSYLKDAEVRLQGSDQLTTSRCCGCGCGLLSSGLQT